MIEVTGLEVIEVTGLEVTEDLLADPAVPAPRTKNNLKLILKLILKLVRKCRTGRESENLFVQFRSVEDSPPMMNNL